jgi:hypothetical protein
LNGIQAQKTVFTSGFLRSAATQNSEYRIQNSVAGRDSEKAPRKNELLLRQIEIEPGTKNHYAFSPAALLLAALSGIGA